MFLERAFFEVKFACFVFKEVEADRGRSNLRSACYHEPVERQLTASPEDESHGKRCATSSSQFQLNEGSPMPPIMSVHRRNIEVPRSVCLQSVLIHWSGWYIYL